MSVLGKNHFNTKKFSLLGIAMRKILVLFIFICLIAEIVYAGVPAPGDKAPDFSLKTLDGKQISLSDMKGKVVLIGMFHICVPCMNQAIEFNKVRDQFDESQVAIIGINTNVDSKEEILNYLSKFPEKVRFP